MKRLLVAVLISAPAYAQDIKWMQFNDRVRIVLFDLPCEMMPNSKLAVAQRIDKQFMRGCYTKSNGSYRIQWSADKSDFTVMPESRFVSDKLPDNEKPPSNSI